jgi:hypothetical protein
MRRIAGIAVLLGVMAAGCATPGGIAVPQADVDAVNRVIEAHRTAFNARNLNGLLVVIAEDARVVSLPVFGTGSQGAAWMARGDQRLLEHASWTVEFADPTHATANGQVQLGDSRGDFQYKLEKRAQGWMIVESTIRRK